MPRFRRTEAFFFGLRPATFPIQHPCPTPGGSGRRSLVWVWVVVGALACVPAGAEIVDQTVATVDTEVILLSEIMTELAPALEQIRMTAGSETAFRQTVDRRVRETLDQAIEGKILFREARLKGLEIDERIVDQRIEELRKLYPSSEEFLRDLEQVGETLSDLRERIHQQLLARAMAAYQIEQFEQDVVVSESEVAQYYADNEAAFMRPERVRCRQLFLPVEKDGPTREVIRARLAMVRQQLEDGASFGELAEVFSQGAGAEDGGLIGWVTRGDEPGKGDLVKPLERAVFAAQEGEITDIIETDYGFHLLKVEERQEAGIAPLGDVRNEIEPILRAQAARDRYDKWIADLRKRRRVRVFI